MNKYLLVALGVMTLLLSGAGYYGYRQTIALGEANAKVDSLETTITHLNTKISENNQQLRFLNASNQALEAEKARNAEKALKDITRVQKIAKRKSKLYENLVNRDFNKTQNELRELTR